MAGNKHSKYGDWTSMHMVGMAGNSVFPLEDLVYAMLSDINDADYIFIISW